MLVKKNQIHYDFTNISINIYIYKYLAHFKVFGNSFGAKMPAARAVLRLLLLVTAPCVLFDRFQGNQLLSIKPPVQQLQQLCFIH